MDVDEGALNPANSHPANPRANITYCLFCNHFIVGNIEWTSKKIETKLSTCSDGIPAFVVCDCATVTTVDFPLKLKSTKFFPISLLSKADK